MTACNATSCGESVELRYFQPSQTAAEKAMSRRVETHYETGDYRSFYTVAVPVAIARETAENFLELSDRIKRNKPDKNHGSIR